MAISDKLTYLNTTKTKIREGLNSLGADLDTEDTFRSYADAIDGIYEDYPKITGEGESLSLDNTKQASMQIDYKGNTSQNGTPTPSSPIPINVVSGDNVVEITGRNLYNNILSNSITTARATISYDNGQIVMTTTGADAYYGSITNTIGETWNETRGQLISIEENTNYTFFSTNSQIDKNFITYYNEDLQSIKVDYNVPYQRTFTTPAKAKYLSFRIGIVNSTSGGVYKFNVMLEKGSAATTYEPYIGHSYPIYLGVLGKNLFDGIIESGGFDSNGLNVVMNSRLRSKDYVKVKPNTTYTVSTTNNDNSRTLQISISKYTKNDYTTPRISYVNWTNLPVTFTTDSNCNFIRLLYKYTNETTMQVSDISNEQVELGNEATTYEKYNPLELCKIGTYQDYIYKDNGKWYLHKEIGKVVFANIGYFASGGVSNIFYTTFITNYAISNNIPYSNQYTGVNNVSGASGMSSQTNNTIGFINQSGSTTPRFYIKDTRFSTEADLNIWIKNNPLEIYYVLATPTNTEITDTTLINQLEESKLSYISQTNISQVNNDLPFNLDVKALRGE